MHGAHALEGERGLQSEKMVTFNKMYSFFFVHSRHESVHLVFLLAYKSGWSGGYLVYYK